MKKSQTKPGYKEEQTRLNEPSPDAALDYEGIRSRLSQLTEVSDAYIGVAFTFSLLFAEIFTRGTPNYEITPGRFGATRSNWTYHTAMAISQSCKMLDLTCRFETLGKRDAVVETQQETPTVILVAEWEWDYEDIFGSGKEIDKLKVSCKASTTAEGFLLIYCPIAKYVNHLERIAEEWIVAMKDEETPPALWLHTIIFEEETGFREFDRLRTVEIHPAEITVWNDRYFL